MRSWTEKLVAILVFILTRLLRTRALALSQTRRCYKSPKETVYKLIQDGKFVIALGGEHSITSAVVEAYRQADPAEPFTVIQIDAHGDLRHEYEGSIYNHACVMRRIVDMGLTQPNWIERAIAAIPTQKVFLTIDLDGIDPTLIPGVGTPEPGGLNWYALIARSKLM